MDYLLTVIQFFNNCINFIRLKDLVDLHTFSFRRQYLCQHVYRYLGLLLQSRRLVTYLYFIYDEYFKNFYVTFFHVIKFLQNFKI